jgi:hypothetical protein
VEARYYPASKRVIVTYQNATQRGPAETVEFVLGRMRQAQPRYDAIIVEANGVGSVLSALITERAQAEGLWYSLTEVNNRLPKADRIGTLPLFAGRGQLGAVSDIGDDFIRAYEQFGTAKYDDQPDALSHLVLYLNREGYLDLAPAPIEEHEK